MCQLTVLASGGGSTSPPAGGHDYVCGTPADITATPDQGWQFDGWSGGPVASPGSAQTSVLMNGDKSVTANFSLIPTPTPTPQCTLTMQANGNGIVTPSPGTHDYACGTTADITATPDQGWRFDGWSGPVGDPSSRHTSVLMNADKTVTANFSLIPTPTPTPLCTLTVQTNGNGIVTPSPGTHDYACGATADITATPDQGWQFDGWTGGPVGDPGSPQTSVLMDADKTVTANFSLVPTPTPCQADFTASPTTCSGPCTVQFTDLSTGTVTSWSWNFGNGQTSTLQNPSVYYSSNGYYTVQLTVRGPGCENTLTRSNYIYVSGCG